MNHEIEFAKDNRTTTFFRDLGILEIRVAYKIMEYLAPDDVFKPKINQFTKDLMLSKEFSKAYEYVIEELDAEVNTDLGCSASADRLQANAIDLMKYLLPIYEASCKDAKEQHRIALIKELKELEA
jgi:hypothetical protein